MMVQVKVGEFPVRARRRRRRVLLAVSLWALAMALVAGMVLFANAPFLRLTTVEIVGARSVAAAVAEARTREELSGSYFGIFPKNNILFYSKDEIIRALLTAHPTLHSVSVGARDFTTITVELRERTPRALWCELEEPSVGCFLLDEDGVVYAPAPQFGEGGPFMRYTGGQKKDTLPWQFLPSGAFRSLAALVDALARASGGVESVAVGSEPNGEVRVRLAAGPSVVFLRADDGGDVFERFNAALGARPFQERPLSEFEYLDLRFGDRVYYKLK